MKNKKAKKIHPTLERDRDADLAALADAFMDSIVQVDSKRHSAGLWGISTRSLLMMGKTGDNRLEHEILATIEYEGGSCEHCGSNGNVIDDEALQYAFDLWENLGGYLADRWGELLQIEKEYHEEKDSEDVSFDDETQEDSEEEDDDSDSDDEEEDEEDYENCYDCGEELDDGECPNCDESE